MSPRWATPGRLRLSACFPRFLEVLICRCCDRDQVYCSGDRAREARRKNQREAARRYQTGCKGRAAHAERARRYRARQTAVTHRVRRCGLRMITHLVETAATESQSSSLRSGPMRPAFSCHPHSQHGAVLCDLDRTAPCSACAIGAGSARGVGKDGLVRGRGREGYGASGPDQMRPRLCSSA
jgi:hypothetical protein